MPACKEVPKRPSVRPPEAAQVALTHVAAAAQQRHRQAQQVVKVGGVGGAQRVFVPEGRTRPGSAHAVRWLSLLAPCRTDDHEVPGTEGSLKQAGSNVLKERRTCPANRPPRRRARPRPRSAASAPAPAAALPAHGKRVTARSGGRRRWPLPAGETGEHREAGGEGPVATAGQAAWSPPAAWAHATSPCRSWPG